MPEAAETARKLVDGTFEVLEGDNAFKAKVAAQIVDQMIGSDPHALVKSIAGVPEALVEPISDALVAALETKVLEKISGGGDPATE